MCAALLLLWLWSRKVELVDTKKERAIYALGIDFGTQSARSVLVDIQTGEELEGILYPYPHGVIDRVLPGTDIPVGQDAALQDPVDYRAGLELLLKQTWEKAGIEPAAVRAIGVDFTSCTVLPVDEKMQPLCEDPAYRDDPHSWVKLWKHHGAQAQADRIREVAQQRGETFLQRYGNQSSSEWYLAKLLEVYEKAPQIYRKMRYFINASDWMNYLMTGQIATSYGAAGFHCFWSEEDGFPDQDFLEALAPGFGNALRDKFPARVYPMCYPFGYLTEEMARKTGLPSGIPVTSPVIDSHAALPAAGLKENGALLMSMGTSLCHIMVSKEEVRIPGICGVVSGGTYPGSYGYEAGQSAVGDIYEWFVNNLVDSKMELEAAEAGESVFDCLTRKALKLRVGESGLVALDWWNGNRCILGSSQLSGLIMGMTLSTRPEEVYRALVEATAYGARTIIENFENNGVPVEKIYACGGLSRKSPLVMQIFADVLGREICVSNRTQAAAYGAAMHAMVALGGEKGGYDSIEQAVAHLAPPMAKCWKPIRENHEKYNALFDIYTQLHELFGKENPQWMRKLKELKV